jgi:serine phosphatase RsbU (regulator of sigma subunit)
MSADGPGWFDRATGDTASGALARSVDWASTAAGAPDTWPPDLRAAVRLCFSTRFPVMIGWGRGLLMIYNDGYVPMLGNKHPSAMGRGVADVWAEIWDDIAPYASTVLATGRPMWIENAPLLIDRAGYPEDTWFTYSYSALTGPDGTPAGILDIAVETTEQVVALRRLGVLGSLSSSLHEARFDLEVALDRARRVLSAAANVPRADVYLLEHGTVRQLMTTGDGTPGPSTELLTRVAVTGRAERVGRVLVEPLPAVSPESDRGAVVLWPHLQRPDDEDQRTFLHLTASTLAKAIAGALLHDRQVTELREVAAALQDAILPAEITTPRWHTRYRPAQAGLAVGGDWYDVVELGAGRVGLVVGDCVGHGLHAAAVMGQLRSAARALLLQDLAPSAVLDGLDAFAGTLAGAETATVLVAVVEPDGRLAYAAAGHPWPLVVRPGHARFLTEGRGAPLTHADVPRRTASAVLAPEDLLVLYTDGLVERREERLSVGLARLREVTAALALDGPEQLADALLATLLGGREQQDDVAIAVFRGAPVRVAPHVVTAGT